MAVLLEWRFSPRFQITLQLGQFSSEGGRKRTSGGGGGGLNSRAGKLIHHFHSPHQPAWLQTQSLRPYSGILVARHYLFKWAFVTWYSLGLFPSLSLRRPASHTILHSPLFVLFRGLFFFFFFSFLHLGASLQISISVEVTPEIVLKIGSGTCCRHQTIYPVDKTEMSCRLVRNEKRAANTSTGVNVRFQPRGECDTIIKGLLSARLFFFHAYLLPHSLWSFFFFLTPRCATEVRARSVFDCTKNKLL